MPAFDIDLVDTTGCGDAYVAGFIVGVANGWDAEAAGWLGAAASGQVATGLGSDSGIVDLESTLEFMASQRPCPHRRPCPPRGGVAPVGQRTAIGLTGPPTPPRIGSGAPAKKNS